MFKQYSFVLMGVSLVTNACGAAGDGAPDVEETGRVTEALVGTDFNVAVYDPFNAIWGIDYNKNGVLDSVEIQPANAFGQAGDIPVAFAPGTFSCTSTTKTTVLAVYRPGAHQFFVDANNSRLWDGGDLTLNVNVTPGGDYQLGRPFVRQVFAPGSTTNCVSQIGITASEYPFPQNVRWFIDKNKDGTITTSEEWIQAMNFGIPEDIPVPLLYGSALESRLAVYRPSALTFYIDANGNGLWNDCGPGMPDACVGPDRFAGSGQTGFTSPFFKNIATYSGGNEFIDMNLNYQWDGSPAPDSAQTVGSGFTTPVLGRYRAF